MDAHRVRPRARRLGQRRPCGSCVHRSRARTRRRVGERVVATPHPAGHRHRQRFSAGLIAISEKGSWPFRARWRVSSGVIERLETPVRIKTSSSRRLEVTPCGSPDVGNDSADLAVCCATIAASIGIKSDEREVQVVYDDHRLHGLHVCTAETIDDAPLLVLDAAAGEEQHAPTRTVTVSVAGSRGWSCSSQQSRRSSCSSLRRTCSASSPVSHFSCRWRWRSALPRTASDRAT